MEDVQKMGERISKKIDRIKAMVSTELVRDKLQTWREHHSHRMSRKQPIIDQYLGCCSFLRRSPFLTTPLRTFLLLPSSDKLDLSGLGITAEDAAAIISALAGRGCNLKPDQVTSVQEVRGALGDALLARIDDPTRPLEVVGSLVRVALLTKLLACQDLR